jgi:cytochrome o ubiquinol oxidase subunit 3
MSAPVMTMTTDDTTKPVFYVVDEHDHPEGSSTMLGF